MGILDFYNYKIIFSASDIDNIDKMKETFYAILTLLSFGERFSYWHSAHVEEGQQGHIVFMQGEFNFIVKIKSNFVLEKFQIYHHQEQRNYIYKPCEYDELYKKIQEFI